MKQLESDLRDHLISTLQDNPNLDLDGLMKAGSGFMANDMLSGGYAQRMAAKTQDTEASPPQDTAQSASDGQAPDNASTTTPTRIRVGAEVKLSQGKKEEVNSGDVQDVQGDSQYADELSRTVEGGELSPSGESEERAGIFDNGFPEEDERGTAADGDRMSQMVADASGKVVPQPASLNGQAVGKAKKDVRLDDEMEKSITKKIYKNLGRGNLNEVHAIVLHRTDTPTAKGVLNSYGAGQTTGAHYLIDTDGKIYQTADLGKKTNHVGTLRRKCETDNTCSDEDVAEAKKVLAQKGKGLHGKLVDQTNREINTKDYPERYPYNGDSIGIEVVGKYNEETERYDPPTEAQIKSVHKLVDAIQKKFKLTNADVYTHGNISYKDESEGQGLGYDE